MKLLKQIEEQLLFKTAKLIASNNEYLPAHSGDVGTVLEILDDTYCIVEFCNPDATTLFLGPVKYEDLDLEVDRNLLKEAIKDKEEERERGQKRGKIAKIIALILCAIIGILFLLKEVFGVF